MLLAQVAAAAALALVSLKGAQAAGRAEESMVFDGKQGDFSDLRPPAPGYIFITPRRVRENAEPMWFEFETSFSLDLWMRPQRLFLGTEIEGGVLTCLVTDALMSRPTPAAPAQACFLGWSINSPHSHEFKSAAIALLQ